jgi:hypothetical protein
MMAVKRKVATGCKVVILNVLCLRSDGRRCASLFSDRVKDPIACPGGYDLQSQHACVVSLHVALYFHVAVLARNFGDLQENSSLLFSRAISRRANSSSKAP